MMPGSPHTPSPAAESAEARRARLIGRLADLALALEHGIAAVADDLEITEQCVLDLVDAEADARRMTAAAREEDEG